jgi:hypothetical protein
MSVYPSEYDIIIVPHSLHALVTIMILSSSEKTDITSIDSSYAGNV